MDDSKEFQLMLNKAIESKPLAFEGFDRTKNVQDQLQEMLRWEEDGQLGVLLLDAFYHWAKAPATIKNFGDNRTTWEQLWLAFVMKEKYGKVWDGESWTN